ncbi:MAG: parB-like partition protein [Firmicutes bacterium]|nr:parB-like partition protein [Bacillota bacterium]
MTKLRGLGRGIDSLITPSLITEGESTAEVAINDIIPNKFQPRRVFDEESLVDLSMSIERYGVLQPVVVRRYITGYELVAGERRWRAARLAGLKSIPAVVRDYTDGEMTEIALIENIQRENLNVIEEALAYRSTLAQS